LALHELLKDSFVILKQPFLPSKNYTGTFSDPFSKASLLSSLFHEMHPLKDLELPGLAQFLYAYSNTLSQSSFRGPHNSASGSRLRPSASAYPSWRRNDCKPGQATGPSGIGLKNTIGISRWRRSFSGHSSHVNSERLRRLKTRWQREAIQREVQKMVGYNWDYRGKARSRYDR
jgi:hypothetical protein